MFALAIPYDHWIKKENNIGFVASLDLSWDLGRGRLLVLSVSYMLRKARTGQRLMQGTLLSKGRSLEEISGETCGDDEKEAVETQRVHTDSSSRTLPLPVVET
ncbi:hypothetical protein Scep_025999 [Stephania cephalantha]|uniref:Uncharacterized protein n=1 Tax=Stephania cephalantha TaxID=152367 RepID=A0AAP0HSY5_9MAGN